MDLYAIYQHADGDVVGDATTKAGAPIGTTFSDAFQNSLLAISFNSDRSNST